MRHLAVEFEHVRAKTVPDGIAGLDLQARNNHAIFQETRFYSRGVELLERLLLRVGRHPVEFLNIFLKRFLERLTIVERTLLALLAESHLHILLPERFAKVAIDKLHTALPAGPQFFRACERRPVKREVLIHERGRQQWSGAVHDVPLQIGLPVIETDVFNRLIERPEELRDSDVERWLSGPDRGRYSTQLIDGASSASCFTCITWSSLFGSRRATTSRCPFASAVSIFITVAAFAAATSGLSPRSGTRAQRARRKLCAVPRIWDRL